MQGTLNALGLIAIIIITVVMIIRFRKNNGDVMRVLYGIMWGLAFMAVASLLTTHMCHAGNPVSQISIPGICIMAVFPMIDDVKIRNIALLVIASAGITLSYHFTELVHSNAYIGSHSHVDQYLRRQQKSNLEMMDAVLLELSKTENTASTYPSGYLSSLAIHKQLTNYQLDKIKASNLLMCRRVTATPLWHTWLTGLNRQGYVDLHLWYPGGKLKDAIGKLEYRSK